MLIHQEHPSNDHRLYLRPASKENKCSQLLFDQKTREFFITIRMG